MIKSPTLVVLAAGMGSRYGSLKQLDRFGPTGETIIDYSVYDAIKAGFHKVVFVIRKSIEEDFKNEILNKFSDKIEVDYVLQELDHLPEGLTAPEEREKPWGTAHAVWVASSKIHGPFAVINADDFYGYQSFKLIADHLKSEANDQLYSLIGYPISHTLSEHGAVSRGICEVDKNNYLQSISERTHIFQSEKGIVYQDEEHNEVSLNGDELVSMNLMGFTPSIFSYIETSFTQFLKVNAQKDLKAELYLPKVLNELIETHQVRVKVLPSSEKWFGVTFPEDKAVVIKNSNELIERGKYPKNLWNES